LSASAISISDQIPHHMTVAKTLRRENSARENTYREDPFTGNTTFTRVTLCIQSDALSDFYFHLNANSSRAKLD
jgi:hypothetical protein